MILALYGAGAIGREFRQIAVRSGDWSEVIFIDDRSDAKEIAGSPVFHFQMFRRKYSPEDVRFVVSIGEPKHRRDTFERMTRAGYRGGVLIDSTAYVSPDAEVGEGTAVYMGAYIGSQARVGKNCFISRNVSVGHDAAVDDHTRLGVNAFVGGHTKIGRRAYIGAGAMLRDRIRIGDESIVALGAAVFEDVPDGATVIGNPARISGEGKDTSVYVSGKKAEGKTAPEGTEKDRVSIPELYWDVFSSCFEGVDFNPVRFRYHDEDWTSLEHMKLIAALEDAFHVSFKGLEVMRIKSYEDGLKMIKKKLGRES